MPEPGDVVITRVKFTDSDNSKIRPALILFEDMSNVIGPASPMAHGQAMTTTETNARTAISRGKANPVLFK